MQESHKFGTEVQNLIGFDKCHLCSSDCLQACLLASPRAEHTHRESLRINIWAGDNDLDWQKIWSCCIKSDQQQITHALLSQPSILINGIFVHLCWFHLVNISLLKFPSFSTSSTLTLHLSVMYTHLHSLLPLLSSSILPEALYLSSTLIFFSTC